MTKPLLAILLLLQLSLILVGCSDPMEEPGEEILVFDFNANLRISSASEVVVKVGGNIIEEGGKLELGDDWVYLKKIKPGTVYRCFGFISSDRRTSCTSFN